MKNTPSQLIVKPHWMSTLENNIGNKITVQPNTLSSFKLFLITPLLLLSFKGGIGLFHSAAWSFFLFVMFCSLDYLDGIVARVQNKESSFGRLYDRLTDYPVLFIVSWQCLTIIPSSLLFIKIAVDSLLLLQFLLKKGTTENRIRTTISYTTLVALLFVSQGWGLSVVTTELVNCLLVANIAFTSIVVLFNAKILQLRFIADMLSAANLLCGLFSIHFARNGRLDISLLFLILGGLFDGFDGAAARKWGGTRWGVYSDDIADGVNYGIAPGFALYFAAGSPEGLICGLVYSFFTISRLVYFTLNKENADPNFFCGVPSTIGGLIVLSSLILFENQPLLTGLLVGFACVQMISFDVHYRHLGRAFSDKRKRFRIGLPMYALFLILGAFIWGTHLSIGFLLLVVLGYGFAPSFIHMKKIFITLGTEND